MTFLDMQNRVYRLMRDPSKTKFDLTTVKFWLNEGEEQYCQLTNYSVKKDISLSTIIGQQEYQMVQDYKSVDGVFYNGVRLFRVPMINTIYPTPNNGTPYAYYIKETTIGLDPIPTAIGQLTIVYRSIGGDMVNDTDISIIPEEDHTLPVFYACYLSAIEGDDTRASAFLQNWTTGLAQAIRSDTLKAFEKFPVVGDVEPIPTPYNHDIEGVLWP